MWIIDLVSALEARKIPYALCGGMAVALHGVVRGTMDVDLVISLELKTLTETERLLKELGLQSRIPVTAKEIFHFRHEYIEKKNLIAWSFVDHRDPSHVVDILLTQDLKELEKVAVSAFGKKIWILSISSLIQTKEHTERAQDLADIKALKLLQSENK